ncbi:hypothetical protein [Halocola ammonii]
MKFRKLFVLLLFPFLASAQSETEPLNIQSSLHLSKHVDTTSQVNRQIIKTLDKFLASKDSALFENKYWVKSDFEKYQFPFIDLHGIEYEDEFAGYYNADLLKILKLNEDNQFMLKIAFVGHDSFQEKSHLKSIYSLLATVSDDKVVFSRSLNYNIRNWKMLERYPITYYISPQKEASESEIEAQLTDIDSLNSFFETDSIELTYYSCVDPIELLRIKGFDYTPGMYFAETGGLVEFGNHVFSGNNSERYTHEITHIYVNTLFPPVHTLLNEGIATYLAGSSGYDYQWHKQNLRDYLSEQEDFSFLDQTQAFAKNYANEHTSIPYMTGALLCEYIIANYGKETLFTMFRGRKPLWEALKEVGVTRENFDEVLLKKVEK